MKSKNQIRDKFQEHKMLIISIILISILCVLILIFTYTSSNEEITSNEKYNNVKYFEDPDRILYKVKNEDKYYIFYKDEKNYEKINNMLITCIDGTENGKALSNEEIKQIEETENYLELDYNTISKNYLIAYEKQDYNVIKRTDNGGVIVESNIKRKEDLKKLINKEIQNMKYYQMNDNKEYKINQKIQFSLEEVKNKNKKIYENEIYEIEMQSKEELDEFLTTYNIDMDEKIEGDVFEKAKVIAMISKYEIDEINPRIGGITYKFKGTPERNNTYNVDLFVASKVINTNCIYRDLTKTSQIIPEKELSNAEIEKLKKDLLNQDEFGVNIKQIKNYSNSIVVTCSVTTYYEQEGGPIVTFEVDMVVDKDTVILSSKENQLEELKKIKERGDTAYIKLREKDKKKGKFVIENMEVMGC